MSRLLWLMLVEVLLSRLLVVELPLLGLVEVLAEGSLVFGQGVGQIRRAGCQLGV